jgi:tetratricopeptide (TPR) repeat protein
MLAFVKLPPRAATRIPRWLRPLLRRGLAADPAKRFPSMDELIRAIERRRHRAMRATLVGLGLAVVVGVIAFSSMDRAQQPQQQSVPCSSFADGVNAVWNDERRELLNERRQLAPESIDHVRDELDRLMQRWLTTATETCSGNDAPAPGDARVECLERWLRVADSYIDLFVRIDDPLTAARAREVVDRLRPPKDSFCAFSPPPAVDFEVWSTSEGARAAAILGADARALELATQALELAQTTAGERQHTADLAEAHAARAEVYARQQHYDDAQHAFEDADLHAHLSGHYELEISNQLLWAKVRALSPKRAFELDKALEDIERARRLLVAVNAELRNRLEAELEDTAGFVEFEREDYGAAIRHHERARQLLSNLDQPVLLAKTLNNLGRAHQMLDESELATATYRQARAVLDAAEIPLGHSISLDVEFNIGLSLANRLDPAAFDHFDNVARSSGGERRLQALDEALTLAVNLEDESRMRTLSQQMLDWMSSASLDSLPLLRIKFDVATALILLADPRGDELFATLDDLPPAVMPPEFSLLLRKSHIRALETRHRCKDATAVLARVDDFARANGLVDDAFREWRALRTSGDCKSPAFSNP